MNISVNWINAYLEGNPLSADELEAALTRAGFPIEEREDLPGGDVRLDVEITSNRGDALCHLGLAREVAGATGRRLLLPMAPIAPGDPERASGEVARHTSVDVRVEERLCPRFTARVLRGVAVGPSPAWLRERLEAIGLRPINNVVDVTNFALFEMGQPSHVFDLDTLAEQRLVVRHATAGEKLTTLDHQDLELTTDDVVVADAERARSLAGVIGGEDSGVTNATTNVLLEAAPWDPRTVRDTARRYNLRTDASHRFERVVDVGQIDECADRIAALIHEVAGGELVPGAIAVGPPLPPDPRIELRVERCRAILGLDAGADEMAATLEGLGFVCDTRGEIITAATPPHRRHDVTREIDLIEEVARGLGLDAIPVHDALPARPAPPQASEEALAALGNALTGMGFYETVTFSFVTRDEAALFMPRGLRVVAVDEARRKEAPALRPSAVPSLLSCRRVNQHAGVEPHEVGGAVRLFETSAVFAETDAGATVENRNLTLLIDAPEPQTAVRELRGAVETIVRRLGGPDRSVTVEPGEPSCDAYRADAFANLSLEGQRLGVFGLIDDAAQKRWELEIPVAAAEVDLDALLELYPPASKAEPLPEFPAIERDLSVVVKEATAWADIEQAALGAHPDLLEGLRFVGVYRGKPLETGQKSVTFRLRFRDPARTLRHEEVDPQVEGVVRALESAVGAELRK